MSFVPTLISEMKSMTNYSELPEQCWVKLDLTCSFNRLEQLEGLRFIWVVRKHGCNLLPLHSGVDPGMLTFYLQPCRNEGVNTYFVDSATGLFKEVSFNQATRLMNETPPLSKDNAVKQVNSVLAFGCKYRLWGVFESPTITSFSSLQEWLAYFKDTKNSLMAKFIGEAISLTSS